MTDQLISSATTHNFSQNTKTRYDDTDSPLFSGDSLLELCNSFWTRVPSARKDIQPYLRGCKWSPDGTCCLCVVNYDGFHVMELPRDLYEGCPTRERMITLLPAVIHVKESGIVYDFCWYPNMNSQDPKTCSWISTKINSPIQMWDAYDGSLRCSYRGFNAVDEMEPAISVTFINQGQRIVGGYKNCLRTFDVERPGREFLEHKIKSPASCFATHLNILAVGSWNANINLFSISDSGTYRSFANLHAHTGGITHLQFLPDGTKLVSGARKDHSLCVWDVRYHKKPLNILKRSVTTNQRIYFDISPCGKYLVSGGTDGVIRIWDDKITKWTEPFNILNNNQENPTYRFQLYRDCCNSVSIHPSRPILATGSGQFHFLDPVKVLESECDRDTNIVSVSVGPQAVAAENIDVSLIEIHKPESPTGVVERKQIATNISIELQTKNSEKELINKISDHDVGKTSKDDMLETSTDEPLAKRPKLSNDIINTSYSEMIDNGTSSVPNMDVVDACNNTAPKLEEMLEDLPNKKVVLNVSETHNEEINENQQHIDNVDKATSKIINYSILPPIKECNILIAKPDDCDSKESSRDKSNPVQSLSESYRADWSPTKISKEYDKEKPPDTKRIIESDLETDDDDCVKEKNMKYSLYPENNLTFWWTAKILDYAST